MYKFTELLRQEEVAPIWFNTFLELFDSILHQLANENNTSSNTSGGSGNDNASDESEEIFSSTSSVESTLDVAATLGAGV